MVKVVLADERRPTSEVQLFPEVSLNSAFNLLIHEIPSGMTLAMTGNSLAVV